MPKRICIARAKRETINFRQKPQALFELIETVFQYINNGFLMQNSFGMSMPVAGGYFFDKQLLHEEVPVIPRIQRIFNKTTTEAGELYDLCMNYFAKNPNLYSHMSASNLWDACSRFIREHLAKIGQEDEDLPPPTFHSTEALHNKHPKFFVKIPQ